MATSPTYAVILMRLPYVFALYGPFYVKEVAERFRDDLRGISQDAYVNVHTLNEYSETWDSLQTASKGK